MVPKKGATVGQTENVDAARVQEIEAMCSCSEAEVVPDDDGRVTVTAILEGEDARIAEAYIAKQWARQQREERKERKQRNLLMRTNPKYRALMEQAVANGTLVPAPQCVAA